MEKNPLERILLVHNFYQIGGGEHTVFENELRLLQEHGHHVVSYTRDNAELNKSIIKKSLLPFTTVFSLKTYKDVKKIIQSENIDIVHCHNTFPLISPSVYYAAWKCNVPVLQTIHNFRFICPNGIFYRDNEICENCVDQGLGCAIKHACYRNSKAQTAVLVNMLKIHRIIGTYKRLRYIFLTSFNKSKFRALLGNKLDMQYIKPNFEYVELPKNHEKRDKSFVFIGRLEKNKGIDFIVDNWEWDRELYIFGDGNLNDYVKRACDNNPYLHYMGFQPQEIIWGYLGKATALVFPTDWYEGFPMTLIESFALSTPVICSNIGNSADIVTNECAGVVFSKRNKTELLKAIQTVESNFDRFSQNARIAYEKHYTPDNNYLQLKRIYEAVRNET